MNKVTVNIDLGGDPSRFTDLQDAVRVMGEAARQLAENPELGKVPLFRDGEAEPWAHVVLLDT